MAWNEPGGSKDRDPWGDRKPDDGPPDLDEVFRKMQEKISGLFGGKGRRGGGGGGAGGTGGILSLVAILLAVWFAWDSVYIIQQAERGVVLRFGKYVTTLEPGFNVRWPQPVEKVIKVNVNEVRRQTLSAQLLTKDLNLININLVVQFKVRDEYKYALAVRNPDFSLRESTESALREVVGGLTIDEIVSAQGGRSELVDAVKVQLQHTIDKYNTGLLTAKVIIDQVKPPDEVRAAYEDAITAKEDLDTEIKKAEAYARGIVPKAEGEAESIIQAAQAYRQRVINKAKGETARFLKILKEYRRAPAVTRTRLYLETMETLLAKSSKVMVKIKDGNSVLYLPIDRFMQQGARPMPRSLPMDPSALPSPSPTQLPSDNPRGSRERGVR